MAHVEMIKCAGENYSPVSSPCLTVPCRGGPIRWIRQTEAPRNGDELMLEEGLESLGGLEESGKQLVAGLRAGMEDIGPWLRLRCKGTEVEDGGVVGRRDAVGGVGAPAHVVYEDNGDIGIDIGRWGRRLDSGNEGVEACEEGLERGPRKWEEGCGEGDDETR